MTRRWRVLTFADPALADLGWADLHAAISTPPNTSTTRRSLKNGAGRSC
jgi:hypothetical protein